MEITNIVELASMWTGSAEQKDPEAFIKKMVYKYTDCGAWIKCLPWGVEVGSIVEGSDATVGPFALRYPFTEQAFDDLLEWVEQEAYDTWVEANNWDCDDNGEDDYDAYDC